MCEKFSTYELIDSPTLSEDNDDGDYNGGDYGDYGDYQDDKFIEEYKLDPIVPEPVVVECYTCHYAKTEYHEQGMPNCNDPFQADGIPVVKCEGWCARTKSIISDKEYMLIRSCLPNCKNIYDESSTVECCFGSKCNGERNDAVILQFLSITFHFVLLAVVHLVIYDEM